MRIVNGYEDGRGRHLVDDMSLVDVIRLGRVGGYFEGGELERINGELEKVAEVLSKLIELLYDKNLMSDKEVLATVLGYYDNSRKHHMHWIEKEKKSEQVQDRV